MSPVYALQINLVLYIVVFVLAPWPDTGIGVDPTCLIKYIPNILAVQIIHLCYVHVLKPK